MRLFPVPVHDVFAYYLAGRPDSSTQATIALFRAWWHGQVQAAAS